MAGGGNDKEQNYWPGFVDALSNVVLTLIFVLVVLIFALAIMANKASKAVEQIVQQRLQEEHAKAVAAAAGASDSTALANGANGIEVEAKDEKKQANRGAVQVQSSSQEIVLVYPVSVLNLDDSSMNTIKGLLAGQKDKILKAHIHIESYQGPEPYSLAQRLAYYRGIEIRNMLIEGGLARPENISNKIVSSSTGDLGRVRIIFAQ